MVSVEPYENSVVLLKKLERFDSFPMRVNSAKKMKNPKNPNESGNIQKTVEESKHPNVYGWGESNPGWAGPGRPGAQQFDDYS